MNSREQFEAWAKDKGLNIGLNWNESYTHVALVAFEAWQASRDCMTPDWQHAPHWANWLAMDAEGQWFWFAEKPTPSTDFWINPWGKRVKEAGLTPARGGWLETLEPRP